MFWSCDSVGSSQLAVESPGHGTDLHNNVHSTSMKLREEGASVPHRQRHGPQRICCPTPVHPNSDIRKRWSNAECFARNAQTCDVDLKTSVGVLLMQWAIFSPDAESRQRWKWARMHGLHFISASVFVHICIWNIWKHSSGTLTWLFLNPRQLQKDQLVNHSPLILVNQSKAGQSEIT